MTPRELRGICEALDTGGRGGKARLALLLDWDYSTLWRKLNGKSRITHADALAIERATHGMLPPG